MRLSLRLNHQRSRTRQRGTALLVVLLLVATLAFIAMSITEKTALAGVRSINERARAESLWRAFGAETLARAAIKAVRKAAPEKMSLDAPWMVEPLIVPTEEGAARIFFADATVCLNVNSLAAPRDEAASGPLPREVFRRLARNLGLGEFEGERLADVIIDWIDDDNRRLPQGAEDDYYMTLPSPYRTGGQPIASVSELRAMNGISRETYTALKPFLCAQPTTLASAVNINMATRADAPLIAAMLGDEFAPLQAEELIAARPAGGFGAVSEFLSDQRAAELGVSAGSLSQFSVVSQYVRARSEVAFGDAILIMTSEFELDETGRTKVLKRRIGAEE